MEDTILITTISLLFISSIVSDILKAKRDARRDKMNQERMEMARMMHAEMTEMNVELAKKIATFLNENWR